MEYFTPFTDLFLTPGAWNFWELCVGLTGDSVWSPHFGLNAQLGAPKGCYMFQRQRRGCSVNVLGHTVKGV